MKSRPLSLCIILVGAALGSRPAAAGTTILDESGYWRFHHTWRTPLVRDKGKLTKLATGRRSKDNLTVHSPAPAKGWTAADFDDRSWGQGTGLICPAGDSRDHGYWGGKRTRPFVQAMVCLRGRFNVKDPAAVRDLRVSLAYRGGAVIYVNGKEVARGHLPKGTITPDTPAEDYPDGAYFCAPKKPLQDHSKQYKAHKDKFALRIRSLGNVKIDRSLLRKGLNVVAVEIHRAPYLLKMLQQRYKTRGGRCHWNPCGLVSVKLEAGGGASPVADRPGCVQLRNVSTLTRLTGKEVNVAKAPLRPVEIVAVCNGSFTGRLEISSAKTLKNVSASAGELKGPGGAAIPTSAVKVLYAVRDSMAMLHEVRAGLLDTLLEEPPASVAPVNGRAVVPVWLKVKVPADAKPGLYKGTVAVSADGLSKTAVPVHLKIFDWKLPDPREYRTHMGIVQSPDSVALYYKVPMWAEKHWQLIEESFKRLEEIGNRYVIIPMICRTNFGNEQSMVRWVKDNGGYKHDFSIAERYLDLALKYTKPDVVVLDLWQPYLGGNWRYGERPVDNGKWKISGPKVTLLDPGSNKTSTLEGPKFGTPAARKFWEAALKGMSQRLEKRGLKDAMMFGLLGDGTPSKEAVALFSELLPGTKWVENGHHNRFGRSMNGAVAGYSTAVYINRFPPPPLNGHKGTRYYGWKREKWCDIFPRMHGPATNGVPLRPDTPLPAFAMILEAALLANCSGLGRTGADFWTISKGRKDRATTITARYPESNQNQLNMFNGTECLLVPGPNGAVTSERFEVLREGLYACEARIYMEKALQGGKLGEELAAKCQKVLDERALTIRAGCVGHTWNWFENLAPNLLAEKLYSAAAEVQEKLGK